VVQDVFVNLVGEAESVELLAEPGDKFHLIGVKTLPVGLFGLQMMIALVLN